MPDVIEKLVEILRKTRYEYRRYIAMKDYEKRIAKTDEEFCAVDDSIVGEIPFCADHLIADGVTIQRWIPVTERLPEDDISSARYLCYANGYVRILKYWRMYKSFEYGGKPIKVTHWMPLPEAPEGQ